MYRACIAIADASRARIFVYERTSDPDGPHEQFTERTDLVDPARRQRASDLFSSAPGQARPGPHGGYGDHREEHLEQFDMDFARSIIAEIAPIVRDPQTSKLVICASPRMLGELRKLTGALERAGLAVEELARNFVKLPTAALHDQLTASGLLPPAPPRPSLQATR
jgi:protein required for attachment to host cells